MTNFGEPYKLFIGAAIIIGAAAYFSIVISYKSYEFLAPNSHLEGGWVHLANISKLQEDTEGYLKSTEIPYSFYASHLPTGTPIKARERDVYVAASLLKLPFAMDVMRQVDMGQVSLDEHVKIKQQFADNRFGNLYKKPVGSYISVEEALSLTLVESDNTALNVLKSLPLGRSSSESVLKTLDIRAVYDANTETLIDTQSYGQILRCLYYSCYLSKQSSEYVLKLLSQAPADGISLGLPDGVKVAHKIGVSQPIKSDCGIVYAKNDNYIFCMMLKTDRGKASQITANVSAMVYKSMTAKSQPNYR
jgi:beta-lactamase class A